MSHPGMTRAIRLGYVDGSHAQALQALAEMSNEYDVCFLKETTLAFLSGVGCRRVKTLIDDLAAWGLIYKRPGIGRGNVSYYLHATGLTAPEIAKRLMSQFKLTPEDAATYATWMVETQRYHAARYRQAQVDALGVKFPDFLREEFLRHQMMAFTGDGDIIVPDGDAPERPVLKSDQKGDQNNTLKKGDRGITNSKGAKAITFSQVKGDPSSQKRGSTDQQKVIPGSQKGDRSAQNESRFTPLASAEQRSEPSHEPDHEPIHEPTNHPTMTHDGHVARHNESVGDRLMGGEDVARMEVLAGGEEPLGVEADRNEHPSILRDRAFFVAGLREVPGAPEGQPEVVQTGLELLAELWQQWHGATPTRPMFDDLIVFAERYDEPSGGYGWYWVVRALQDAARVATVPGSVNYIEGIVRRWATQHTWGQPYRAGRQPELPSARRNGARSFSHAAERSQVDSRLEQARMRGLAQLGEDD